MACMPAMGIAGELGALDAPAGGEHFGEHFMIDAYRGSREKLLDRQLVQQCLSELPERLGMHKLAEPTVHWAEPNGLKDPGGWSGVVVIIESHISIHLSLPAASPASTSTPAAMVCREPQSKPTFAKCSASRNWRRILLCGASGIRQRTTDRLVVSCQINASAP